MNWINSFELICYAVTVMLLADVIRKKAWQELYLFLSAAFAGFALELLAVRVTGIYHYSKDFFISLGVEPYQFPFFGGLMWGGLTVYALRIARKLNLPILWTALVSGWLIVTWDLLLDVAAIRLDGGFWVWEGREISLRIDHHMFMSVIWVNFLGYLFETPAIIGLTLRTAKKAADWPVLKRIGLALLIGMAGIAFVGTASGLSLLLNSVTDEWFACAAFILLWCTILFTLLRQIIRKPARKAKEWDVPVLIFWTTMYGYCLAALVHLGLAKAQPLYFFFGVVLAAFTVCLIIRKPQAAP